LARRPPQVIGTTSQAVPEALPGLPAASRLKLAGFRPPKVGQSRIRPPPTGDPKRRAIFRRYLRLRLFAGKTILLLGIGMLATLWLGKV
jgi:hypothetical protein